MENASQIEILKSQIRECYGKVAWSHKTHEKCADILNNRNSAFKIIQIILSALITSGLLGIIFDDQQWIKIATTSFSVLLLVFSAYLKEYDLGEIAQKHANAASDLWNVREKYLSLLSDLQGETINIDEIKRTRDKLQQELYCVYQGAPRTVSKAYSQASKALHDFEELTFSDEEIDNILPPMLRKKEKY